MDDLTVVTAFLEFEHGLVTSWPRRYYLAEGKMGFVGAFVNVVHVLKVVGGLADIAATGVDESYGCRSSPSCLDILLAFSGVCSTAAPSQRSRYTFTPTTALFMLLLTVPLQRIQPLSPTEVAPKSVVGSFVPLRHWKEQTESLSFAS